MINKVAEATNINAAKNITRAEGYYSPLADGVTELGDMQFVPVYIMVAVHTQGKNGLKNPVFL